MAEDMEAAMYVCSRCHGETPNRSEIRNSDGILIYVTHYCDACSKRLDLEYDFQSENETIQETELICPWCGSSYEDYYAYGFDCDEDEVECMFCGKHFDLEIETRRRYSTKRSLCDMPEDYGKEEEDD